MNRNTILSILGLSLALATFAACSDDSPTTTNNNNPFTPGTSSGATSGSTSSGTSGNPGTSSGSADCAKPVGCFCGTPTTQAEFLNRCTNAAALPVNLTVKPATVANVP